VGGGRCNLVACPEDPVNVAELIGLGGGGFANPGPDRQQVRPDAPEQHQAPKDPGTE
jgi:hypothetical protein